jgi:phosphatidylserine/phosphatidylglycerophosphate/cardiolipin synthase-like enzyme
VDDIQVSFLCQGCQQAGDVARQLAAYIGQATGTIDIAIYSFFLGAETRDIIAAALKDRADAGVAIRIAYDAGSQQGQLPVGGYDPNVLDTPNFVRGLGFPSKAIEGFRVLMHHKYAVIDAGTPGAQVWTGSVNWTDDSWTLQESNIIVLRSQELASYFTNDFNELWAAGNVDTSGKMDHGEMNLQYGGQPALVRVDFAPAEGEVIDQGLAKLIDGTQQRLTLACVVLTSGRILNALQGLMQRGVPLDGIYDATQMAQVQQQWQAVPGNQWKIPAWQSIVEYGHLVGKHSTPYTPTSRHDFMHNKVMVADGTVVTGSYNFSRHAQANAENILMIDSLPLVETYRQYIQSIVEKYSGTSTL